MKGKLKTWSITFNGIDEKYIDLIETTNNDKLRQVMCSTYVEEKMKECGLFGAANHVPGTYNYHITLNRLKHPKTHLTHVSVNFNRNNITFSLIGVPNNTLYIKYSLETKTGQEIKYDEHKKSPYFDDEDVNIVDQMRDIINIVEKYVNSKADDSIYIRLNKDSLDMNNVRFVELCNIFTKNIRLSSLLCSLGYADTTARDFHDNVDLNELKKTPGIGKKTIDVIRHIYVHFGLETGSK